MTTTNEHDVTVWQVLPNRINGNQRMNWARCTCHWWRCEPEWAVDSVTMTRSALGHLATHDPDYKPTSSRRWL